MYPRNKYAFIVACMSILFSITGNTTQAKKHHAFVKNWNMSMEKKLRESPTGTYCIIEDIEIEDEGTYKLIINNNGKLIEKEFRHDRDYVTREIDSQFNFVNLYVKEVEDLFYGNKNNKFDFNNTIEISQALNSFIK
jgi:hypothetical protein